ncbi:hypothetical protein ACFXKD_27875 [Nocardiopsis aegyptia]|uniref:WDGH domain-containing protein n=1 Tax=Nocardiopsis aegyptia TaxID=220378 RepID=UPI00366FF4AA
MDVYRERAHLVAHLASQHPAVLAYSDPDEPAWPVITVSTPAGQMTWHLSPDDLDLVAHVPVVSADDPRAAWDGHDTATKYERLRALTEKHPPPDGPDRARRPSGRPDRTRRRGLPVRSHP